MSGIIMAIAAPSYSGPYVGWNVRPKNLEVPRPSTGVEILGNEQRALAQPFWRKLYPFQQCQALCFGRKKSFCRVFAVHEGLFWHFYIVFFSVVML